MIYLKKSSIQSFFGQVNAQFVLNKSKNIYLIIKQGNPLQLYLY